MLHVTMLLSVGKINRSILTLKISKQMPLEEGVLRTVLLLLFFEGGNDCGGKFHPVKSHTYVFSR